MFTYNELIKYKISDLENLAEYLDINIGGLEKAELAQLLHDYYNVPQEVPDNNMSVRIRRIFEANKKE